MDLRKVPMEQYRAPESHHCRIFGRKHAVTIYPAPSQKRTYWTAIVEAAESSGNRTFQWEHKLALAPKVADLNGLVSTLLGLRSEVKVRTASGQLSAVWQTETSSPTMSEAQRDNFPLIIRCSGEEQSHQVPVARGDLPSVLVAFARPASASMDLALSDYLSIIRAQTAV